MKTRTKLIGGIATIAALSAAGIGVAAADPTSPASPSSTPSSATHQKAGHAGHKGEHKGQGLLGRALHGQATVGGAKKHRVVDFQRGSVTSVGGGKITVKSVDGYSATYATTAQTKVRKDKAASSLGAVQVNDRVRVVGTASGSTVTVTTITDRGPKK